jgi:uncharacterized protein with FMN-binding domain
VAIIILIGAVVAVFKGASRPVADVAGALPTSSSSSTTSAQSVQTSSTSATNALNAPATSAAGRSTAPTYKDGTYSADGNYNSPGGPDSISVTLTLQNDIVTNATVTPNPGDRTSARYQNMFVSGYKQYVVGKDLSTLNLTKVSGSSLTPIGFDNALVKIKAEAQS